MAAPKFKTLEEVLRHYQIQSKKTRFKETISRNVSESLQNDINFVLEFVSRTKFLKWRSVKI